MRDTPHRVVPAAHPVVAPRGRGRGAGGGCAVPVVPEDENRVVGKQDDVTGIGD